MAADTHINGGEGTSSKKHSSLWLLDGNIVLIDERRSILFRIHKSMLSRQSQVFSDMFALPTAITTPAGDDDTLEDLPLIRMHDSAEDLEALLTYLYDPTLVVLLLGVTVFQNAEDGIDKTLLSHVLDIRTLQ